jgi:hypothetical protein
MKSVCVQQPGCQCDTYKWKPNHPKAPSTIGRMTFHEFHGYTVPPNTKPTRREQSEATNMALPIQSTRRTACFHVLGFSWCKRRNTIMMIMVTPAIGIFTMKSVKPTCTTVRFPTIKYPSPVGSRKSTAYYGSNNGTNSCWRLNVAQIFPSLSQRNKIAYDEFNEHHDTA